MIAIVYVFVLLQINAPLAIEGSDLSGSKCSRIVAKPFGKSDPIIFIAYKNSDLRGRRDGREKSIDIKDARCYIQDELIGDPCYRNSEYFNITVNNVEKFEEVQLFSLENFCIVKFVHNCEFKAAKPGEVVPQESFPFVRFERGNSFVSINLSKKGLNSRTVSALRKHAKVICLWRGKIVEENVPGNYCGNMTENRAKDQLDYTFEYQRDNLESNTSFEFICDTSRVGVTIYWEEEGVSPDIIECQKYDGVTTTSKMYDGTTTTSMEYEVVTSTSKGCSIAYIFSVAAVGISQLIFQ
nr:hypothetical transcript [Hymenolepis microstoma]